MLKEIAIKNVSGGGNLRHKFMPISFFRRASRFYVLQERDFKEFPMSFAGVYLVC